jgi:signal transduction histidine kinase
VRAPAKISKRHDELAELAVDFDSMVERIGILIAAQRDLLNNVSHELRSPLARFNVSLALLRKQSSSQSEPLLQRMEREVGRVDVLMGQILTLLRLEAGLSSREWKTVNFSQLVEEVVADGDFEAQAFGKSVRLQAETDISIQKADEHALRSACENVVRNAIRFTPTGREVEVILKSEAESSLPQAVLLIRDHGPGVPEDSLPQIFKPFFRVQSPSGARTENNGTGLGLAIALEAVRQHRGSIVAANTIPTGLEVRIMLPTRPS